MRKVFIHRFFKMGRIPQELDSAFEPEGILFRGEGLSGWMIMRNIRARGKRFKRRRSWFAGFLVLTRRRLAAFAFGNPVIDVMCGSPEFSKIQVSCGRPNRAEITFESSGIIRDWSGEVVLRYKTPEAVRFCKKFAELQAAYFRNI